jgi:predicted RNase H-like nuclease (RuvC/YqgF family)
MIADEFSALRGEIEGIKTSVSFLSNDYDSLKERILILEKLRDENNHLKNRVSELERGSLDSGVAIDKLTEDVNNREQYNRFENLEITGVPQVKDEDTRSIIHKISEKINVNLNDADVIFCRRVSPWNDKGGTPQKLIVKFTRRNIVDNMLSAVRKRNGITARDLGFENDTSRIYLNCHLTPSNKRLLREVKLRAKTKEYQFCWVKHCMIYVRKDSESPALLIRKGSDMKKMT